MRTGNSFDERLFGRCVFVPLVGAEGFEIVPAPDNPRDGGTNPAVSQ
jgi:hypothetical protein